MNCRRIEELLPLFVEGDLDGSTMQAVAHHVQGCAGCSAQLEEFGASQSWLRSERLPEFDDAFFTELRQNVLRELRDREPRPSFFHKLREGWNPSPRWAMAVLALILIGALAFFLSARRQRGIDANDLLTQTPPQVAPQDQPKPKERGAEHRNEPQVVHHRPKKAPARDLKLTLPPVDPDKTNVAEAVAENRPESPGEQDPINTGEPYGEFKLDKFFEQMTRMEFQTNDPNIRIIWFAPKVSSPQSTKVDTE